MSAILKDICESYQDGTMTSDTDSPAADAQRQIQEAMSFKGGEQEKQTQVFCSQLGINYDRLTKEQFVNVIEILKQSDYMKSPYSRQG